METVSNVARAAANAVWGENTTSGKEPVSGQQGNTSIGEPYDKGNLEEPSSTTNTTAGSTSNVTGASTSNTTGASTLNTPGASTLNTTGASTSDATGASTSNTTGASTSDTTGASTSNTTGASTSNTTGGNANDWTDHSKDAEFAKTTGTAAESDKVPDNKQTELKAKDTPADTSKGQNDTRDPENPQTNPKNNPTDVDDSADGPNEAQKLDGPGPKPLTEVAKEHGGDAGNKETTATGDDKSKEKGPQTDDPNDPHAPSKGEGTGEKYVKSSGLAADGGDFDATKPGAGREADRLLEEKGIHIEKGPKKDAADDHPTSTGGDEKTEKRSLKDKIKDKLHRH